MCDEIIKTLDTDFEDTTNLEIEDEMNDDSDDQYIGYDRDHQK